MKALADKWRKMLVELERVKIAHGDFQQGNILVPRDNFLLIDYDGMWVPALEGSAAIENGHRAFQHPARSKKDFGPTLDRFSALVMYLSIVALEKNPTLWEQFHTGDNLIFVQEDFVHAGETPIWASLAALKNSQVSFLADQLKLALSKPPMEVPALEAMLARIPSGLPAWLDFIPPPFRST